MFRNWLSDVAEKRKSSLNAYKGSLFIVARLSSKPYSLGIKLAVWELSLGEAGVAEDRLFPRRAALCSYRITGRQRAFDAEKSRVHGARGPNLRSLPLSSQMIATAPLVSVPEMRNERY